MFGSKTSIHRRLKRKIKINTEASSHLIFPGEKFNFFVAVLNNQNQQLLNLAPVSEAKENYYLFE